MHSSEHTTEKNHHTENNQRERNGFALAFAQLNAKEGFILGVVVGIISLLALSFLFGYLEKGLSGFSIGSGNVAQPPSQKALEPKKVEGGLSSELFKKFAAEQGVDMRAFESCLTDPAVAQKVEDELQLGISLGVEGTPTSFVNGKPIRGAVPYSQLKQAIDEDLNALKAGKPLPQVAGRQKIEIGKNDFIRGAANGRITIVEFSDFECPFCQRFKPSIAQALREYPNDVRVVYKHFPLDSIHPDARPAAIAAECVGRQKGSEGFYNFHDALFGAL